MAKTTAAASPENRNPRVDQYIADAAPFARPILAHLRHVVHAACPAVAEEIKWSMPFFVYGGNLCHMAAFKAHCAFGFWRSKEIAGLSHATGEPAMGSFGRIGSLDDLPAKRPLTTFIKAAMKLNEGESKPVRATAKRATLTMPTDFASSLAVHADAAKRFAAFSPSGKYDYLEWILDAKRESTRASRIATAIEWIAEGKQRHWKYQK